MNNDGFFMWFRPIIPIFTVNLDLVQKLTLSIYCLGLHGTVWQGYILYIINFNMESKDCLVPDNSDNQPLLDEFGGSPWSNITTQITYISCPVRQLVAKIQQTKVSDIDLAEVHRILSTCTYPKRGDGIYALLKFSFKKQIPIDVEVLSSSLDDLEADPNFWIMILKHPYLKQEKYIIIRNLCFQKLNELERRGRGEHELVAKSFIHSGLLTEAMDCLQRYNTSYPEKDESNLDICNIRFHLALRLWNIPLAIRCADWFFVPWNIDPISTAALPGSHDKKKRDIARIILLYHTLSRQDDAVHRDSYNQLRIEYPAIAACIDEYDLQQNPIRTSRAFAKSWVPIDLIMRKPIDRVAARWVTSSDQ